MYDLQRRLKKISSVLRVKKVYQRQLISELSLLQRERHEVSSNLRNKQDSYVLGVNRLNQLRQSSRRDGLDLFEAHIERLKVAWVTLFRQKQEMDRAIILMSQKLNFLKRQMEAVERIQSQYRLQGLRFQERKSQDEMDALYGVRIQKGPS